MPVGPDGAKIISACALYPKSVIQLLMNTHQVSTVPVNRSLPTLVSDGRYIAAMNFDRVLMLLTFKRGSGRNSPVSRWAPQLVEESDYVYFLHEEDHPQ
jgi:hypothetical protein